MAPTDLLVLQERCLYFGEDCVFNHPGTPQGPLAQAPAPKVNAKAKAKAGAKAGAKTQAKAKAKGKQGSGGVALDALQEPGEQGE